jgi:hypothetical protein
MFLWYPVMDLARALRRTARKKGSGYENAPPPNHLVPVFSCKKALNIKKIKIKIKIKIEGLGLGWVSWVPKST